ncbi:sulfotransferase domain-containing protein [Catenuloplanes sp. NPDC051500]|uniref:sulfotransferase domain-containing protein n=1 Tax=Catenuloplanes sp. NPDC051500 TaxID=3363959 RepID=UPI0037AF5398
MALPDFLIAGVPKAGTTALHAALVRHPALHLSAVKEPKFFLTDGPPPTHGGPGDIQTYQEHIWEREQYEALFANAAPGALRGEATPFYLHDFEAQRRIKKLIPDVKLILMLRDPVDRAHSNWQHLWTAGLEPEADFITAMRREPERIAAGWAAFWHYAGLGQYGSQVQHLFELFDRDQVLILRYRDLRETPAYTLDRVCGFLGVETGVIDVVPQANVNFSVADTQLNSILRYLLRSGAQVGHRYPVWLRKAARGPLLTALHRERGKRPRPTPEQRAEVLPAFVDEIRLLEQVTGTPYDDWTRVTTTSARPV